MRPQRAPSGQTFRPSLPPGHQRAHMLSPLERDAPEGGVQGNKCEQGRRLIPALGNQPWMGGFQGLGLTPLASGEDFDFERRKNKRRAEKELPQRVRPKPSQPGGAKE